MSNCAECGVRLEGGGLCRSRSCRRKHQLALLRERRRALRDVAIAAARRRLARLGRRPGLADPATVPIAVLPANQRRLAVLPAERRRAFRAHLAAAIAEAIRHPRSRRAGALPPPAAPPPAVAAACATCAGHCCTLGAEHAFLDADVVRRYRARTGIDSPRALARAFLRYLPAIGYRDSCVYHARTGCSLPREMRADLCNRFYCGALREQWSMLEGADAAPVVLAAADGGAVKRMAAVEGTGTRRPAESA
jgi:hypothetical protein